MRARLCGAPLPVRRKVTTALQRPAGEGGREFSHRTRAGPGAACRLIWRRRRQCWSCSILGPGCRSRVIKGEGLDSIQADIEAAYRRESRRVLATLLRLLNGNFDVAEEALQEAFVEAVKYWPEQGVPGNPRT